MAATSGQELSEAEKLRMDRQLHALGEEMVRRMKNSRVFISGLGGLGVEIAKNVALAGCKELVLHDTAAASVYDLATHFYLSEASVGQNRAAVSLARLAELNPFCPVAAVTDDLWALADGELSAYLRGFGCVLLTEATLAVQTRVNDLCHALNVPFLAADQRGLFCKAFVDVGERFEVWDKDGEAPLEVLIGGVVKGAPNTLVHCLEYQKSPFSAGDRVTFREVKGMEALNGGGPYTVVDSAFDANTKTGSFTLELDSTSYADYVPGAGRAVQHKPTATVAHRPLASYLNRHPGDQLLISDYAKFDNPAQIHLAFSALDHFQSSAGGALPRPWHADDAEAVLAAARELNSRSPVVDTVDEALVRAFAHTARGSLSPLCGFLGGFVSQEVLKAVSGKFTPLNQLFYLDLLEVLPEQASSDTSSGDRYTAQRICLGPALCERIATARLFTVGAGAIGCELIKNYAMLGAATQGSGEIVLTDDDRIELSNLNRQFLFRDKDLGSFKSTTAAEAARQMNAAVRVTAHQRRVEKKSEDLFSNRFLESVDCVVNALDNVQARQYMDARAVENQRPLIDSGTLSAKGHVQVVVPFLTESYGSQTDPASAEVPFCTIKSFPHDVSHCIQWARDLCFEKQFATRPHQWNKLFATPDPAATVAAPDGAAYRPDVVCKMAANRPATIDDCVRRARLKWEKMFVHAPNDLLYAFPLDHKDKDGNPFWASPKRPPHPLVWSSSDPLCLLYVTAYANLLAYVYGLPPCRDAAHIARVADAVPVPAWAPKRKDIETDESKKAPQPDSKAGRLDAGSLRGMVERVRALAAAGPVAPLAVVDFEKDDDANFHVDCIHATANLRARVYSIDEITRMDTKRIAGRILPALATTTACVSGWAMSQLLVVLAGGRPIDAYKNFFMNLALPLFQLSEPGPTKKIGKPGAYYDTIWDQWKIHDPSMTVQQLLDHVRTVHHFETDSIFLDGVVTIFLGFMHGSNQARLNKRVIDSLPEPPPPDAEYLLLTLIPPDDDDDDADDDDADEEEKQDGALVRFYLR